MKTQCKFTRTLTAAFVSAAISAAALAAGPTECGLIGTWLGEEPNDMVWLGVHTAGSATTKGVMQMNWVYVNPSLQAPETTLMPGVGAWEQTGRGQYNYTWYAYGIDKVIGEPVYSVRVSGTATNATCDKVNITYVYEIYYPAVGPADMSLSNPNLAGLKSGTASETRLPLTVVTLP